MGVNKDKPHLFVLPEDDANSDLANGFHLEITSIRQMQVLPVAGGWHEVLDRFRSDYIIKMQSNAKTFMVLLIDFDGKSDRLKWVKAAIPPGLTDRVFVLGTLYEPEDLKRAHLGSYETIGSALAQDCRNNRYAVWRHSLLHHNRCELARLRKRVRPILF